MRIGLLSDSHGRPEPTQRAVRLLVDEGVDLLLHLGDIETAEVLETLVGGVDHAGRLVPPVRVVFGNTDRSPSPLRRHADRLGIAVDHPAGRLSLAGKRLVFLHGHEGSHFEATVEEGADYLCHGHTHCPRDDRLGSTRVINPGALHRAPSYTVATLDVAADRVGWIDVPK